MNNNDNESLVRFQQAMHDSKGKTNNSLAKMLIDLTDASTDDIVRLAGQAGNQGYYNTWAMGRGKVINDQDRKYYKNLFKSIKHKPLTLRDYSWYFDTDHKELLPDKIAIVRDYSGYTTKYRDNVKDVMHFILNPKEDLHYECLIVMNFKNMLDELKNKEFYTDGAIDRFLDDERMKDITLGVLHNTIKENEQNIGLTSSVRTASTYNIYRTDRSTVNIYNGLCSKAYFIESIMINECYDKYISSQDYKVDKHRVYRMSNIFCGKIRDWDNDEHVKKNIEKLFKITRTYELLYEMGIGMFSHCDRAVTQAQFGRVNTRVRTIYKKFMNAKTVDERKNLRDLLLSQLKVIAVDFAGHRYDFGIMEDVVKDQDEKFEKNNKNSKTTKSKKVVQVKGQPSGTRIDISKFANARTTEVTSYRS